MKNLLFILLLSLLFADVSFAAFSVSDTLVVKQDTLQKEEIKQYHDNLIKMGIDLNDCKCEFCRQGNKFSKNDNLQQSSVSGLYILSGVILLAVIIWSLISFNRFYDCLDNRSNCPQSNGEKPNNGPPASMYWQSLLILISIGVAIKARFIQMRNKRSIAK